MRRVARVLFILLLAQAALPLPTKAVDGDPNAPDLVGFYSVANHNDWLRVVNNASSPAIRTPDGRYLCMTRHKSSNRADRGHWHIGRAESDGRCWERLDGNDTAKASMPFVMVAAQPGHVYEWVPAMGYYQNVRVNGIVSVGAGDFGGWRTPCLAVEGHGFIGEYLPGLGCRALNPDGRPDEWVSAYFVLRVRKASEAPWPGYERTIYQVAQLTRFAELAHQWPHDQVDNNYLRGAVTELLGPGTGVGSYPYGNSNKQPDTMWIRVDNGGTSVIAFRGTRGPNKGCPKICVDCSLVKLTDCSPGWQINLTGAPTPLVPDGVTKRWHTGWLSAARTVYNDVKNTIVAIRKDPKLGPNQRIILAGHSQGGAIATYVAAFLMLDAPGVLRPGDMLIPFAAPRSAIVDLTSSPWNDGFKDASRKHGLIHLSVEWAKPFDTVATSWSQDIAGVPALATERPWSSPYNTINYSVDNQVPVMTKNTSNNGIHDMRNYVFAAAHWVMKAHPENCANQPCRQSDQYSGPDNSTKPFLDFGLKHPIPMEGN